MAPPVVQGPEGDQAFLLAVQAPGNDRLPIGTAQRAAPETELLHLAFQWAYLEVGLAARRGQGRGSGGHLLPIRKEPQRAVGEDGAHVGPALQSVPIAEEGVV